jgi:hypothetical protein
MLVHRQPMPDGAGKQIYRVRISEAPIAPMIDPIVPGWRGGFSPRWGATECRLSRHCRSGPRPER